MRRLIALVAAAGVGLLACGASSAAQSGAGADSYPNRPIRLIVPYPPGGGNDTLARIFGQKLTESWGQQVVVDNRGGAGTISGAQLAARSPADGYTLLLSSIASHAIAPNLYRKSGYDPIKDFTPVTLLAIAPTVLCVNPSVPARSLQELLALAKAKAGELKYASGGAGTPPHMAGEIFATMTGVKLLHVPYKGGGLAIAALIGGETTMMFDTAASILPHVAGGKLRALAIARESRLPDFPNVPTFVEGGVKGYEVNAWYSIQAPAGVSRPIVMKVNRELVRILGTADIKERLRQLG